MAVTLKSIVAANKRLYVRYADGTEFEFASLEDLKAWASDIPDDIERRLVVRDAALAADTKTITAVKDLTVDLAKVSVETARAVK